MPLILRKDKTTPLTYIEMDDNFEYLEDLTDTILSNSDVRGLISVTDSGGDGSLSYNSSTGAITYTGPSATETRAHFSASNASGDGSLSYSSSTGVFTYTGPSATETRAHFSAGNGIDITAGVVSVPVNSINDTMLDFGTGANQISTDDLPEGSTNQYYTVARADSRIALASIDDLSDVDARPASQGDVLTYSSVDDAYIPVAPPGATGGEANDGFNTGTGEGIFKQKVGVDLEFKSLIAGNGIGITNNANDLTIEYTGVASDFDLVNNKIINLADPTANQDGATKIYVDTQVGAVDFDFSGDSGTGTIIANSETLLIAGTSNEITTSASGNSLTIGLPSTFSKDIYASDGSTLIVDVSTSTVTGAFVGNVTGNADTATTAGTVTEAAQSNITSVGTLTSLTMGGDIAMGNNTISGLADPTANQDAATKTYVDTIAAAGLHYHNPVRVEQEGNLTVTYDNGTDGVGATLTNAGTQAALVVDGVTLNTNDRVLVYEQTDATQNGVYIVTDTGSVSTNWIMTRATDADSYGASDKDSLGEGDAFYVQEGAVGAGELYVMNTTGAITFGTTNITFSQISSAQIYSASTGLDLTGTTFSLSHLGIESLIDPDADRIAFWDDSASAVGWLTVGSGLSLSDTTLSSTAASYTAGEGLTLTSTEFSIDLTDTTKFTSTNTAGKAVVRDGTGNFSAGIITASLTGNAATATELESARTIGGVSFNGTANIDLPGVNTAGTQDTSGNAATATALETARTIGGVSFNGTANINLPGVNTAGTQDTSGNADTATLASTVDIVENNSTNEAVYLTFVDGPTGTQGLETDTGLSYNPSSNTLSTTVFSGTASQAQYADLAENYTTDAEYTPGTVLKLGGDAEVTQTTTADDTQVVGVVSSNPAYLMNRLLPGVPVAMTGRVPVKVKGPVTKGQRLVSSNEPGVAVAKEDLDLTSVLTVIGRALESNTSNEIKLVECIVGKL